MTQYDVIYMEQAEYDLRGIFEYIAFTLLEPIIAKNQVNRIIDAVTGLNHMPERFPLYDKKPWRRKGLRIMPVDNYLVFYLPAKSKTIIYVMRIMYGGRDIAEQLW